jgi:hypothetical protein
MLLRIYIMYTSCYCRNTSEFAPKTKKEECMGKDSIGVGKVEGDDRRRPTGSPLPRSAASRCDGIPKFRVARVMRPPGHARSFCAAQHADAARFIALAL